MKFTVFITDRAQADIERNGSWWATHHSEVQSREWMKAIRQQLRTLEQFPERCSLAPENILVSYELRQLLVGLGSRKTFRAVSRIVENDVHVLLVHRGSQDAIHPAEL